MPRTDFTADQKAEIFVLDRATCTYSGRNLWIADYGVDPIYQIDWADHVIPASRDGPSSVENGAAASYLYNYLRGKDRQRLALFHRGLPTVEHTTYVGVIDVDVAARFERFASLTLSDWFLNRAMWHVTLATAFEYQRRAGAKRSRDYAYYSQCAWKSLSTWRRMAAKERVTSIEERGLNPARAEPDHTALLSIRNAASTADILDLINQLFPLYEAEALLTDRLVKVETAEDIRSVARDAQETASLMPRIRRRITEYCATLGKLWGLAGSEATNAPNQAMQTTAGRSRWTTSSSGGDKLGKRR